jgi:ABC-type branched-subunit amino acid transport system ATPase component/ABC-type branched-subunit amino acid transport system permease subunit
VGLGITVPIAHFQIPLEIVVLGAITGTAYSLFGMGLSLTYQSARVVNFAQGSMGAVPALFVASRVVDHGWSYWVAVPMALILATATGALMELLIMRRLANSPRLVILVATIAVAQLLLIPGQFMVHLNHTKLGTTPFPVPIHHTFRLLGAHLTGGDILTVIVVPLLTVALSLFMRRTNVGLASRAIAENAEAAEAAGVPIRTISLAVWSIAGLLAGVAAILLGPTQPVLGGLFGAGGTGAISNNSDLLLRGLGAAMMGGLVYLPQVFAAGIALGIVEALFHWNYPTHGTVDLVIVVLIGGSLLVRRDLRQLARGTEESSWSLSGSVRPLAERFRRMPNVRAAHGAVVAVGLGAAVLIPYLAAPSQRVLYSAITLFTLMSLSLVILTGWAGQVSLGQAAFVGLGALVGGRVEQLGYPFFGAMMFVVAAGVVTAAVVGLPALRLRGLFLAVTTLAFAVLVDRYLTQAHWLVNNGASSTGSESLRRPVAHGVNFNNELTYYYLMLAITVLAMVGVRQLARSGVARRLIAVRDNETMAAALSVSPAGTKLTAFMLSGAVASLAGFFYGMLLINFGSVGLTSPQLSLSLMAMVIVGGATSITGAILGALYIRGIPYFVTANWVLLLTSGGGLLLVILAVPGGLASLAFRVRNWAIRHLTGEDPTSHDATDQARQPLRLEPRARRVAGADDPPDIEVCAATVSFGGLQALDNVSLHAAHGEIVGLIGPNGAGKTTLFDVLSGLVEPDSGSVLLQGEDITGLPPEERAMLGLARSFQLARLFDDLTVSDVLKVALERDEPTELVPSLLALPPARAAERRKELRARDLMDLLGLGPFAERKARELSTGTRRIVELGCTIALGAAVILLDEPTGGIAQREVEAFSPVLCQIRDHLDATMIVVAHDLPMILGLADRMYVMASGAVIAEGAPNVLLRDPDVIAAYIGTRSGVGLPPVGEAGRRPSITTATGG